MIKNIVLRALQSTDFRHVLETGYNTQVVIMSLPPGTDIGAEVHDDNDQVLLVVEGSGKAVIDEVETPFEKNDLVLIKAGSKHNIINSGGMDMKIITTYSPAHHPDGTIHKTKADASAPHVDE